MLDWQGRVAECTGANVFFIKRRRHPHAGRRLLPRWHHAATVIELARRRGVEVVERRIMPDELDGFAECFITGTAAEVTPVSEIGPFRFTAGRHHRR